MDAAGEPSYAEDAKKDYDAGQEARSSGRFLDAQKYFEHVRFKFPYSSYAALADLAMADTNFDREKYIEAVEGYRSFLKMHPSHEQADYAAFRIALSHYKDIPSDFFLFPPSTQKDQTSIREAQTDLVSFLKDWPDSTHAPEAKKLLAEVRHRLAEHELSVADFYLHRDRWNAAAGRLEHVLAEYPGSDVEGEVLLKLGRSYLKMGEVEKGRAALERLVHDHPDDSHRGEAERLLKSGT
jgi:outer membrane protein assembly factor BamD